MQDLPTETAVAEQRVYLVIACVIPLLPLLPEEGRTLRVDLGIGGERLTVESGIARIDRNAPLGAVNGYGMHATGSLQNLTDVYFYGNRRSAGKCRYPCGRRHGVDSVGNGGQSPGAA
ncbi:hypothetical protein D9M72_472080 [compost metagenome]